jgi:hypothetical protein
MSWRWPCAHAVWLGVAALGCASGSGASHANGSGVGPGQSPESEVDGALPEPAAGKRAPCTLGADQTCNADERVSALWGRCTELGVCECAAGFVLNPGGRCQPQAQSTQPQAQSTQPQAQ